MSGREKDTTMAVGYFEVGLSIELQNQSINMLAISCIPAFEVERVMGGGRNGQLKCYKNGP